MFRLLHLLIPLFLALAAESPDGEPGLNYLCAGFQRFFKHALPTVNRIAAVLQKNSLIR